MTAEDLPVPFNDLGRISPDLQEETLATIARVVESGWFIMGPEHDALEQEIAEFVNVGHAALVGNGTDALVLALSALGVKYGDLVLTCANAGGYTSIAARQLGAIPVYCDVDPVTLLADLPSVQAGVSAAFKSHGKSPAAIVVTHLFGASASVAEITEWAHSQDIPVVEDCAQAFGGFHGTIRLGSVGDIATTSFYPTKNLGALGDGGAVFTNSEELDNRVRSLRQYGWGHKYQSVIEGGMNSRCDEIQAAVLRTKLRQLDSVNTRRRDIHSQYETALNSPSARLVTNSKADYVGHLAVLFVDDRLAAQQHFERFGVKTDIHYPICDHLQPIAGESLVSLPISEHAAAHILSIPLFPELSDAEVARVITALQEL